MKRSILAIAALGTSLALAIPVVAQQAGTGGTGQPMQHMMQMMQGGEADHFRHMCENADAHVAGVLAFAETRLKITEQQRPAWAKFAEAVKTAQAPMIEHCRTYATEAPETATLPQMLDRVEKGMQTRLAGFEQIKPAVLELYGQLTPEQQKIADELVHHHHHFGHPF